MFSHSARHWAWKLEMLSCQVLWKQHDIFYGKITHHLLYIARILWYLLDDKDSYPHILIHRHALHQQYPSNFTRGKRSGNPLQCFWILRPLERRSSTIVIFLHKRLQKWKKSGTFPCSVPRHHEIFNEALYFYKLQTKHRSGFLISTWIRMYISSNSSDSSSTAC